MMRIRLLFVALFSTICLFASAQSVGLVLSGGGAKGLYHIGVIKALEENGIPIDYISGTSIGAIIGGLYAIGYTPDEIGEVLKSPGVNNWITGKIEEKYSYYFKQMRESAAMITLRLDSGKKKNLAAQLPTNLVPSDQLDMAFLDFFGAIDVVIDGDFNNLMVPLRCVATDARNQREVVFREGKLGAAIRSSMSIPFMYDPVKTDSALYFDGGLFNNFPWEPLMDDFNPDILIGSSCTASFLEGDDANLMEQVFMITMLHTKYRLPRETDILIDRMFPEISLLAFDKAEYLIEQGYHDAMTQMERIKQEIARRDDILDLTAKRRQFRDKVPVLRFDEINMTGLTESQEGYVRKLLRIERDGMPVSFDKFRTEYFKILAEGHIDGDFPTATYNTTSKCFALNINMNSKPSFKVMLGGNLSSTALNQVYVGLEYMKIGRVAQSHNLDSYFSAFHTSVSLNSRVDFFVNSPLYFEYGGQVNFYNYFRSNYGFLVKGNDVNYSKYRDHYATVALGIPSSRHSVINLRVNAGQDEYMYYEQALHGENDLMDRTKFRFVGAKLEFERKSMNYILYPTYGVSQQLSVIYVKGEERFSPRIDVGERKKMKRQWFGTKFKREQYFRPWGKWISLGYMVEGVATNQPDFLNEYATNISAPAFQPTQHSKIVYMKEFRSNVYVAAGLIPIFHFGQNFYLKTSGYIFVPSKLDRIKDNIRQRPRYIFDASLVYQSILGPVSLSLSQYDTKSNNWFVTFNLGIALFNPKGIFY